MPILLRYNINNYVGVGTGIQANFNIYDKTETDTQIDLYENSTPFYIVNSKKIPSSVKESFNGFKTGLLFDLTAGFARIGPSLGARYVVNFKENYNYWQFYGIWKF